MIGWMQRIYERIHKPHPLYIPTAHVQRDTGGWYFWDEGWQRRYGPFASQEIAEREREAYYATPPTPLPPPEDDPA